MNRILKILLIPVIAMLALQACYDDYINDYEYTTTYFAMQDPLRTILVEEGLEAQFEVGAMLGGKYTNDKTETVYFEIKPELLNAYPQLKILPEDYYTISSSTEFVIPSGKFLGTVSITLNDNFFRDDSAFKAYYALPFKITDATTDSILPEMDYSIVALKYQNEYYGAYRIKGVDYKLDNANQPVDTFLYSEPDLVLNNYTTLSTVALDTSIVPYVGLDISGANAMKFGIKADGTVAITSQLEGDISNVTGSGKYNKDEKVFYLDYTYLKTDSTGVNMHQVFDTLHFFTKPMAKESWK